MNEFPPPRADAAGAARAARLAALANRRSDVPSPAATVASTPRATSPTQAAGVAERLATSAARCAEASALPAPTPKQATPRRRHPAKGARAAALGLSLASTGGLAAFFALTGSADGSQVEAAQILSAAPAASPTPTTSAAPASAADAGPATSIHATAPAATTAPAPTSEPAPVQPTVVNGGTFHNKWGDVQVQATFAAGSLVDVTALQTPDRDGKSVRINDSAVPRLNSEALTAQSANVDTVSGATYTSTDYRRSLQSAIDAAAVAGVTVPTA